MTRHLIYFINGLLILLSTTSAKPFDKNDDSDDSLIEENEDSVLFPYKRQAISELPDDDQIASETGYHNKDHSKGAKFFMYAHQPGKKQYEFGFKRGSDKHTIERYEKAGPNHNFKAKVRWHDSKGGHGEHFWDYNHAPKYDHKDGHGYEHGDHKDGHGYGHGGGGYHSEPVPEYAEPEKRENNHYTNIDLDDNAFEASDPINNAQILKRSGMEMFPNQQSSKSDEEEESVTESPSAFPFILGYDPYLPPDIALRKPTKASKFKSAFSFPKKVKKQFVPDPKKIKVPSQKEESDTSFKPILKQESIIPKLAYDIDTGRIYEENSKTWFKLIPL